MKIDFRLQFKTLDDITTFKCKQRIWNITTHIYAQDDDDHEMNNHFHEKKFEILTDKEIFT